MSSPGNYFLTVLAPIDYVRGGPQKKLRALEDYLDALETKQPFEGDGAGDRVPFARMPMVHMARFLIIDEIPVQMGNEKSGQLASKYLLFIAELDGDRDTFLKAFFNVNTYNDVAIEVFGKCIGFPSECQEHQFLRYIKQYEIESTLPYAAYPSVTQPQVQNMLSLRNDLTNFIANHQVSSPQELYDDWQSFIGDLDSLDLTRLQKRQTRRSTS